MEFTDFNDVKCAKPDLESIKSELTRLTSAVSEAKKAKDVIDAVYSEFKASDRIDTDYQIAYIRHTIDIRDKYYDSLSDFYDENLPLIASFENGFLKAVLASPFRRELEAEFGSYAFVKAETQLKVFKPEIIPDLQKENALVSRYDRLMGDAKAKFRGETLPITKFDPLMTSPDRQTRKESSEAYWGFFASHESDLADIYDKLVEVRTDIAHKLGYASFTPVAYLRLGRTDYGPDEVRDYREQVYENIVPLDRKLRERQAKRIGIDDMHYYDYALDFRTGNPKPEGTPDELVAKASKMYSEMNPIPSHYFDFMVSHHMMDLTAREGKIPGGYMTYIPGLRSSFIFSNFNGSSADVDVLTHEFGHSLQGFLAADIKVPLLRSPGYESCEIHSMSMEFFAHPWMGLFFGAQANKYLFAHLSNAISFIPYGVSVDEFQHFVYEHPEAGHEERKKAWRAIERKYLPHRRYGEDNAFLESGGYWMRQLHIFVDPFYYIDYTLAQVGAFEFFAESLADFDKAFNKYLAFCRLGGTLPYRRLMAAAGIRDPMIKGTIASLIPTLESYLNGIDDSGF